MTPTSRFIARLLLPLLFFCGSYLLFFWLGEGLIPPLPLQIISLVIALLVGSLPLILFSFLIHSQLKPGFALLKNGNIVTLEEITIDMVAANRITAWRLYQQHLDTEVCLQGDGELVYVKMGLDFELPANEHGKRFIKHYKHNLSVFEAWVQRAIYLASQHDKELLALIPEDVLLNEEDERLLRSKILSALEAQPLTSVVLPHDASAIHLDRKVRTLPIATTRQASITEQDDDELQLDTSLLDSLAQNGNG